MPDASAGELIVRAFYTAVARGDEARLREILAPDWEEIPVVYPGQPKGPDGYLPIVRAFNAAFPDGEFVIHEILPSGDRCIARTTATGTHSAPFFGREATGARIQFATIDIHEVRGGRVTRSWHIEDIAGAQAMMDAAKPPA